MHIKTKPGAHMYNVHLFPHVKHPYYYHANCLGQRLTHVSNI